MLYEESFGTIALKKENNSWLTFLVKLKSGNHWGFPKGHPNLSETAQQTAQRELKEETDLEVIRYLYDEPIVEQYQFKKNNDVVIKKAYYFLAEVKNEAKIHPNEILDGCWIDIKKAADKITYPQSKEIAKQVDIILQKL